jgi:hypothetical protein
LVQHLYARVKDVQLMPGVTKKVLESIPGLETETFYQPEQRKVTYFDTARSLLKKCGVGKDREACIWYENVGTTQLRPDWKATWQVRRQS